jgi:hypothetical protein
MSPWKTWILGSNFLYKHGLTNTYDFLTIAELYKVNEERRGIHKTYLDTQATMEILKSVHTPLLTKYSLVKYLYIGANNKKYWNNYHMSLQFEDAVDCLQVLYTEFDF